MRSIANLWSMIGLRRYDLCATLYYDSRYRWLTLPVRSQRKVALSRRSRETMLIPGRHHTDEYIRVLSGNDDGYHDDSTPLIRPDRLPSSPWQRINRRHAIALVPGGASNMLRQQVLRRWPLDNYVKIAKRLLERGADVLLLGGPDDSWISPYFEGLAVTNLVGKLSLPEVITVCDECDVVVSHDTGPMHLAGLSKACLVALFGPTDPGNFLPRRQYVVGIWGGHGFGCRPCYDGRDFPSCGYNGCMHQVSPDLVLRELDLLLAAKSEEAPYPWRIVTPDVSQTLVSVV